MWGVGDVSENFFRFDEVMKRGPDGRPRECYIFAPQKDNALDKKARAIKGDYIALQLILSSIPGVKQADALQPTCDAVFVHVSEINEIGRYPTGRLGALEHFRERPIGHTIFVLFGDSGTEKVFHQFWGTSQFFLAFSLSAVCRVVLADIRC
jgi:hypothetical protein